MLNRLTLLGRLTADPQLERAVNDKKLCKICVAVDRNYKNKDGVRETDFFNVTLWEQNAEFVTTHFNKGDYITIDGEIFNNRYKNKHDEMMSVINIKVDRVGFGGKSKKSEAETHSVIDEEFEELEDFGFDGISFDE